MRLAAVALLVFAACSEKSAAPSANSEPTPQAPTAAPTSTRRGPISAGYTVRDLRADPVASAFADRSGVAWKTIEMEVAKSLSGPLKTEPAFIVLGVLETAGDVGPRWVTTQAMVTEGGFFVAIVSELERPLSFRLLGRDPVELGLTSFGAGAVLDVGRVSLPPVPIDQLASVRGRIVIDGTDATSATVVVTPVPGPLNGPAGSRVTVRAPPGKGTTKPAADGTFEITGLSSMPHDLMISAPGYLVVRRQFEPPKGGQTALGELILAKRATLQIEYIATNSTDFSSVPKKDSELAAGAGWVPRDGDPIVLAIQQAGSELRFSSTFPTTRIVDLGKGRLRARKLEFEGDDMQLPTQVKALTGHVYLAHYQPDGWVLLRIKRIVW